MVSLGAPSSIIPQRLRVQRGAALLDGCSSESEEFLQTHFYV